MNLDRLVENGFAVQNGFLSQGELDSVFGEYEELLAAKKFQPAKIGKGSRHQLSPEIRTDSILWFDPEIMGQGQRLLWNRLEDLRNQLNRELFLGLVDLEGHFAFYPSGGFYKRHIDRFRHDDARFISIVLYLNSGWKKEHGGELSLMDLQQTERTIEPHAGDLVIFRSDLIEHEVRPSFAPRRSFAGWFRRRDPKVL